MSDDVFSEFNELWHEYREAPSLENFLEMRAKHPGVEFDVSLHGGIDWLIASKDWLEELGIEPQLMAGALDATPSAVQQVSTRIIQLLIDRQRLLNDGQTHVVSRQKAISDETVNHLIAVLLDAQSWSGSMTLTPELIVLIRHQLGTDNSPIAEKTEKHQMRKRCVWVAGQLKAMGQPYSMRSVAKILNLAPSTISRWYSDAEFQASAEKYSNFFDATGKSKPLF